MIIEDNQSICWRIDLPELYFDLLSDDCGLVVGHIDDYKTFLEFSGNWSDYTNLLEEYEGIVHTSINIINTRGDLRNILIPTGVGRLYCFNDSPDINYCPTIFQAKDKIVSLCHCTCNWDGLLNSSILTICASTGKFFNHYFETSWLEEMVARYNELASDIDMWSNGGVQLYLDEREERLLIHSDYLGKYEASLVLEWHDEKWNFSDFVPGTFPHKAETLQFNVSCSSLNQRSIYKK